MKKPLLIAAMLTASAGAASAASETMTFTGTVSATCQITIDSGGVLGASADLMTLSTTEAGGSAGTATIQASDSSFQVTAVAPASFTSAPAGGNTASPSPPSTQHPERQRPRRWTDQCPPRLRPA